MTYEFDLPRETERVRLDRRSEDRVRVEALSHEYDLLEAREFQTEAPDE